MTYEEDRERARLEEESARLQQEAVDIVDIKLLTAVVQCLLLTHPDPESVRILWDERMAVLWAAVGSGGRPDRDSALWREGQERWEKLMPPRRA